MIARTLISSSQERRSYPRISGLCRVFDLKGNFLGVIFNLSPTGLSMVVDRNLSYDNELSLSLIYGHSVALSEITTTIKPVWRKPRNLAYDELGGLVVGEDKVLSFYRFFYQCQELNKNQYCTYVRDNSLKTLVKLHK